MFQASKALFIYCVSPVHMGAGTALGLIDNPIQRERHTEYPLIAGSGLKGAVRHHFRAQLNGDGEMLTRLFGPDNGRNASDHAGAVSFADAQLVAFPVRSMKRGYVYATSPLALARAARLLEMTGSKASWPEVGSPKEGTCGVVDRELEGALALEVFQYSASRDEKLVKVAEWLADNALPEGNAYRFFRNKLKTDLVLLPDEEFGYFVRNATVVEPHVRINDESGTADDGGLFYTENLPPESLLVTALMASVERYKTRPDKALDAKKVLNAVLGGGEEIPWKGLDKQLLQIGGDATTGRGQVVLTAVGGEQ